MELRWFADPEAFLAHATPMLAEHEAENNLPLGIAGSLARDPRRPGAAPPYLATVDTDGAPVAAAVMTPPSRLILARTFYPASLDMLAADVRARYGTLPGVLAPAPLGHDFAARWQRLTGQPARPGRTHRGYRLAAVTPPASVTGRLRRAVAADRALLIDWLTAFDVEESGVADRAAARQMVDNRLASTTSAFYLWDDGQPVSLTGYYGPTPHGIRIGPVYTPPAWRRRGYASACVAAVSQLLLDGGRRFCALSTDRANVTSNHVYQAIGYQPVCDIEEYDFGGSASAEPGGQAAGRVI